MGLQKRSKLFEVRARETDNDEKMVIEGYALTFEDETVLYSYNGNDYKEVLDINSLRNTKMDSVPLRYNHSQDVLLLATTRNNTLRLTVDSKGLHIEADIAPTTVGKDVYTLIKRGDINKMSFSFRIREDEYDPDTRTTRILDIAELYDVSVVDVPAYETTELFARSKALQNILKRGGNEMTEEEKKALEAEIEKADEVKDETDSETKVETETTEEVISDSETEEVTDEEEVTTEDEETEEADSDEVESEVEEEVTETRSKQTILNEKRAKAKALTDKKEIANVEKTIERTKNVGGTNMNTEKLYRSAFIKNLLGREDEFTAEERSVFTQTTANANGALLPTTMLDEIWDLVSERHSIMGDIRIIRSNTTIEINKRTAIAKGDAAVTAEGIANDDEQNTFVTVTLSGKDFSKHVVISYAMRNMSIASFEAYLIAEIADRLGDAMAKDVVAQIKNDIDKGNIVTSASTTTVTFAELVSLFSKLKRVDRRIVYVNNENLYNLLVGLVDDNKRPIFQNSLQEDSYGRLLGAEIHIEEAVDGILIMDPNRFVYNMVTDIMIETEKDIKTHTYTYAGYARGEGALIDSQSAALLKLATE